MFALSWVFLAAAIGALVFGLSQEGLTFIWISIAASVLAMLFMLGGVLRRPVRPATAGAPYGPPPGEAARRPEAVAASARTEERPSAVASRATTRPERKPAATRPQSKTAAARPSTPAATEAAEAETTTAKRTTAKKSAAKKTAAKKASSQKTAAAAKPASDRSQVLALPERGTYHLSGCRIVKGRRDTEKITRGTAKRRGYSACGICKPAA